MQPTEARFQLVKEVHDEGPTIAIDLGTNYAYVAVDNQGKIEILPHENGEKGFPCVVSFTETERLFGRAAKTLAPSNPQNTVYGFKRMMGKAFTDPLLQEDIKKWPFKVEQDHLNRPVVVVTYKGETKRFHPEQLTAMILIRLKEAAQKFLGTIVKKAVITVPAYFRDSQRQATKDAAALAGLTVTRLINEPAAAAVAYGLHPTFPKGEVKVFIYELGSGTFDASVVNIEDGFIQILSTVGDTHLGAEDIDNRTVECWIERIKKEKNVDISKDWSAVQTLKSESAKVRRALSIQKQTQGKIDQKTGHPFEYKMTRKEWEELSEPILKKTEELAKKALADANMQALAINEVILAGGGTHAPIVTEQLKKLFPGKSIHSSLDTDQVVVMGAALLARDIASDSGAKQKPSSLLLINVLPMSLGIEGQNGQMCVLIRRDTSIPTTTKQIFSTSEDNQQAILVTIYQGEDKLVKNNHILGTFKLGGLPPAPKGQPAIEVVLQVDADGILTLKAVDTGNAKPIDTPVLKWTLSRQEVEKLRESGLYYEQIQMPKKPSHLDEID